MQLERLVGRSQGAWQCRHGASMFVKVTPNEAKLEELPSLLDRYLELEQRDVSASDCIAEGPGLVSICSGSRGWFTVTSQGEQCSNGMRHHPANCTSGHRLRGDGIIGVLCLP